MISSKKLLQLARKWKMTAVIGGSKKCSSDSGGASISQKGHFTVYTTEGKRFEIPLSHLSNGVMGELFAMAEEEFGIPSGGAIILPINASSMEYITSLIRRGLAEEQEKTLLMSLARCNSHVPTNEAQTCSQVMCT